MPSVGPLITVTEEAGQDGPSQPNRWVNLIHETLIKAAQATPGILAEPRPFVFQTSLDDFYVSYEINAYTRSPLLMANIYSGLHQSIQDKCNQAGIEILSPHYSSLRDGNMSTIPEDYLPKNYKAPKFRLDNK